ncbi:MAG TPA: hypothetical protein PK692_01755 [Bacteroidales bacterium]|nr:MAG: hypothetical protein BWX63_01080 [Bacteroidetes bacterium ADurb.Bin041]HNV49701.1 hypothetical protein [Bacteroidales bacterium]HOG66278.1 hypothetical protein [Bacteroidales bacterium]HPA11748.1 hypothetical protein [Bacteroidales bacterium]HPW42226.1 hypothetical protein [Bacteroidales bacterium]
MKIKNLVFLLIAALLFACKPELDNITTTDGQADFSKYVAIGNSLTAGYTDGELFLSGQNNSYPSIIAHQMLAAGGGEFKQPLMLDEYGFGKRLLLNAKAQAPVPAGKPVNMANFNSIASQGPFNNLGAPGARSFHLIPGAEAFSALNPYYKRFAAQPGTSTILDEALAQNPTFFSLWIGANDVLGYAISGGASDSITNPALYQMALDVILQQLTKSGAKGIVANIPSITSTPYFAFMNTRLPFDGLVLKLEQQVAALNYGYAQLNALIKMMGSTDTIVFKLGANPFVIVDKDLPWGIRQMKAGELFLLRLPTDSIANHGLGSLIPIPDMHVLTQLEIDRVETATYNYNAIILQLANQYDLAHVDIHGLLEKISKDGIIYDGIKFTSSYVTGNTFSLDGVHITGQANAMVANEFIKAINSKYGSQLKEVSPLYYSGLYYY